MKKSAFLPVLLLSGLGLAAQSSSSNGFSAAELAQGSRILVDYCSRCHDWAQDYDSIMASGVVTPGKVSESLAWIMVSTGRMPAEGPAPTAEEQRLLRAWIEAGAPAQTK